MTTAENARVTNRREIERFLRQDPNLHLFALGDLHEPYWSRTQWFGLHDGKKLRQIAVLYQGSTMPYLAALTRDDVAGLAELLDTIAPLLPEEFAVTVHPGLVALVQRQFRVSSRTSFVQMSLSLPERLDAVDTERVVLLGPEDRAEVERFYEVAYPHNLFHPDALTTGQFFGVRQEGRLVGAGGVHVYSPKAKVAALGNIATHPDYRRQGIARAVTAGICRSVLREAKHVGLLVEHSNSAAIRCYEQVGLIRHNLVDIVQVSGRTKQGNELLRRTMHSC